MTEHSEKPFATVVGLDEKTIHSLQVSLIALHDEWRNALFRALTATNELSEFIKNFEKEEFEMIDRWENEGGYAWY